MKYVKLNKLIVRLESIELKEIALENGTLWMIEVNKGRETYMNKLYSDRAEAEKIFDYSMAASTHDLIIFL